MESIFHLIFELVKIAILASLYAWILFFVFKQINKSNPKSWFQQLTSDKKKFLSRGRKIISLSLFVWMFTYWGDHGFGDSARIPIGNGYAVSNINWTEYGYLNKIRTGDGREIEMTKFVIDKNKLIGNLDSWFEPFGNSYFVLDLKTDELIEFATTKEFDKYNNKSGLLKSDDLKSFAKNYREHWSGWRFWLLP